MRSSETTRNRTGRAGFSMVELLVAIAIIGVLAGLLLVVLSGARGAARGASDSQLLSNIKVGIGLFEDDHGFIPPLVKDNSREKYVGGWQDSLGRGIFDGFPDNRPVDVANGRVNVFSFSPRASQEDVDYLRGDGIDLYPTNKSDGDYRFSEYSLAYYLVGALPGSVDNVDGPGLANPERNGGFDGDTKRVASYLDIGDPPDLVGLRPGSDPEELRYELRDSSGNAVRFYRWLPNENARAGGDFNVPTMVARYEPTDLNDAGDTVERISDPKIRAAGWAAVTAGPDGFFGDPGTEDIVEMALEAGIPFDEGSIDAETARELTVSLSEDNSVIVGDR